MSGESQINEQTGSGTGTETERERPPVEFAWTVHPARENPRKALLGGVMILIIAGSAAALCFTEGVGPWYCAAVGIGAAVVLALALHKFFFPSRFEIDAEGITAKHLMSEARVEWRHIRRFVHNEYGGYLSRRVRRSWFDAWQGMHLLFGAQRERAIAEIDRRIETHRKTSEKATSTQSSSDASSQAEEAASP